VKSNHSQATAGIGYAVCGARDLPEIIDLIGTTFAANDPPAIAVGLTPDEMAVYLTATMSTHSADDLTVMAREISSGVAAGALIAFDAAAKLGPIDGLSPKFKPIMGIFEELEGQLGPSTATCAGETLSLLMLGVADTFARRGIAQELVRTCLANGAQRGFRRAVTIATNPVSQHIFRKLGFSTLATSSYADYRHEGKAVFASIADRGGPMAMARDNNPYGKPARRAPG
jgi:ribosomal protein S18 acetylase RimI-like enzyme